MCLGQCLAHSKHVTDNFLKIFFKEEMDFKMKKWIKVYFFKSCRHY